MSPYMSRFMPVDPYRPDVAKEDEPQLTFRAVGTGLLVGSLLCCSNTYFGLQTGWVTMGSLQVGIRAPGKDRAKLVC